MRYIGTIALNELKRMLRVKQTLFLLLLLPLLLIFILGNALSSEFSTNDQTFETITVGYMNMDEQNSAAQPILSEDIGPLTFVDYPNRDDLMEALKGKVVGYGLVIPEQFSESVARGTTASWELLPGLNDSDNVIARAVLESVADRISDQRALVLAAGPVAVMKENNSGSPSPAVQVVRPDMSGKDYSAIQYYTSAMLIMFLLYGGMSAGLSLTHEKQKHVLERLYSLPVKPMTLLAGKMLGQGAVLSLQALVIILFTRWVYGVEWGSDPYSLAGVCALCIIGSLSLSIIIASVTSNPRMVQAIFTSIIIIMTFLSGGFSPDVGEFIANLGTYTFSHWATQSFLHVMLNSSSDIIMHHLTILGLIALGLFSVATTLSRKAVSL